MHALPQTLQEGWTRGRTVAAASARADKRRVAAVGVPDAGVLGAIVSAYSKLQSPRAKLFFLEFCSDPEVNLLYLGVHCGFPVYLSFFSPQLPGFSESAVRIPVFPGVFRNIRKEFLLHR